MNQPKVSVIIPVYNTEKYLRECLDSVVNQSLKDIEIICVDDGSMDGSCQILRSYAERDSRVRLIEKETNGGTLSARMAGTFAAEGKYIMHVDSDDYLDLSACETAYREITTKKVDVVQFTCGVEEYSNNNEAKKWLENYLSVKDQILNSKELQNSLFIKRDIATSLYGKIYDAPKCKLAYRNTPEIYSVIGEDIFQQFFFSIFVESYVGVSTIPLYWYRHGVGVMNNNWTDLSKYENLCKMALLYEQSVHFAEYVQKDKELLKCAEALGIRMCEDGIRIWNNRVPDDRKDDAFTLFWYYWHGFHGVGEVIRRITGKQHEVLLETYLKIPKYVKLAARYKEDTDWKPLVSVIIPVYYTEKYLRECLDSIVNQTLKDIEIICVNDGSVDGSLRILEEYQEKDPRITVISQANAGLSAARNSGMKYARGEYIDFLDSDDLLELNALETAYKIAKDRNLDIIQFEREMFFDSEKLARNPPFHIKQIIESTEVMSGIQYVISSKSQGTYVVSVCFALWRRAFLEKHGIVFKEGIIHEDNLFSFHAYMAADRVMRIPDRFYLRRVREKSTMTSPKSAKNVIGYFSCAVAVMQYALNNTDPDKQQESEREYTQMLGAARRNYDVISDEEKDKICFASEIENELFDQLIKDRARLDKSNDQVKLQIKRFQRELEDKRKESDTLRRELDNSRKESDTLRRDLEQQKQRAERLQDALDNKKKESDTLRRDLEKQKQRAERLQDALDNKKKESDTLRRDLEKQKKRADTLQYDLDCVHDSVSFCIGRAITWAPRKMRGGVQCYHDHGAGYTLRRALYHMGLWKDEEEELTRKRDYMNNPKVSVIIPVYNAEPYLADTLQSLYAQTYHNIEIFFVDDGSTDRSVEIIRRYTAAHPEAHLLLQEHKFAGAARNYGMQYAQGKYLLFLDADDIFHPDMIEKAVARAEETNADICVFLPERYDQKTGLKKTMTWACDAKLCPKETETFSRLTNSKNIFRFTLAVPWNKLFRRSFIEANKLNFQNTQSSNDVAFVMAALALADRIALCNTVLLTYRANNQTSLQGSRDSNPLSFFEARLELKRRLIERNVFDEVELAYVNFALYGCIYYLKTMKTQKSFEQTFNFLKNSGFSELDLLRWPKDSFYQNPQYRIFENREAIMALTAEEYAKSYHLFNYSVPVVSVIIPVYNAEKYLRECLDSVVNQTLRDIEIICVDDGSTDSSLNILREYAAKDSRVKVYTQRNQFAGVARNHGMEIASGRYYAFMDADDYYLPDALSRMFDLCEKYELDYIKAGYYRTEAGKEPYDTPFTVNEYVSKKDLGRRLSFPADMDSLRKVSDVPWNGLYRASFIKDNGITFNNFRVMNDHSFFVNCVIHAKRAMIINDHVVCHRVNQATSLVGTRHKHFQCQIDNYYLVRRMIEHLDQPHKRKLLQREMAGIFQWYNKLYPVADSFYQNQMHSQLLAFTADFDENDVGGELLFRSMSDKKLYYSIREELQKNVSKHSYSFSDVYNGLLQCYHDNGLGYTFRRTLYHLGLWEDEENPDYNKRPLLKRFSDCCTEHSAPYTAWRVLVKLHMAKDGEEPVLIQRWETKMPVQKGPAKTTAPAQKKPVKATGPVKKDYAYYSTLPPEKFPEELKLWYKRVMKEELDLDNPKTYNEKIQWMKLYDSTPLKTRLADKYLVRDWVKKKIGEEYLIPLLGVWESFDEIDFDKLPNQFVLKANHGCGWNIIVKDKSTFDKEEARKQFDVWMHTNFAFKWGLELLYMNIPPKIIAEEYLENNDDDLYDYKVFCFDGKAESVMFLSNRQQELRMSFYDLQWNKLPFVYSHPQNLDEVPKPKNLELMINLAEKLAEGFPHVRTDFYVLNDGSIKFGEMTFTSASGTCKWNIPEQDEVYGDLIKLPPKSPIPMRLIYQDKRPVN